MSLEPYWGEFLVSPIPLEMSLHWCTHACAVCFANLGKPGRRANVQSIANLLAQHGERSTPAAMLLREGYPVLLSNKVDPFAASNYQIALPLIETMVDLGIPIAFQTRGGQGIDEALAMVPRSCWYVSISQADDNLRAKLEPGAPTLESRFRLIEKLVTAGHHVSLGLNPVVPEWLPDPRPVLERAKACGVTGAWIENLHLNPKQLANMPPRSRAAVGEEIIARAQRRTQSPLDREAFNVARNEAQDLGLEIFSIGQPNASEYFAPYREVYPKTFPVLQDFVNWCWQARPDAVIDFPLFWSFFDTLPGGSHNIGHYLGAKAHDLMEGVSNWMTYRELASWIYREPKVAQCPARVPCLGYAGHRTAGGDWVTLLDEENEDLPFLAWSPDGDAEGGENELHVEVDDDGIVRRILEDPTQQERQVVHAEVPSSPALPPVVDRGGAATEERRSPSRQAAQPVGAQAETTSVDRRRGSRGAPVAGAVGEGEA